MHTRRGSFLCPKHHFSFGCIRGLKKQLYFLPTTFPLHRKRDTHTPAHTRALSAHGQTGKTRQGGTRVLHPRRSGFSTGGGGQRPGLPGRRSGPSARRALGRQGRPGTLRGSAADTSNETANGSLVGLETGCFRPPPHTKSQKIKGKNTAPHKQVSEGKPELCGIIKYEQKWPNTFSSGFFLRLKSSQTQAAWFMLSEQTEE